LAGNRTRDDHQPTTRSSSDEFAHRMYYEPHDFDVVDRVVELAARRDVTPAQIALAWLLHKPAVTAPIIGASKIHHLEQSAEAVNIELSPDEMDFLEEPYRPHAILGHS
jgi:aryl-alcohol dehydrogenase (NADP+)